MVSRTQRADSESPSIGFARLRFLPKGFVNRLGDNLPWFALAAIELFALFAILLPFFQENSLLSGDTPGHLAAARFLRDHLFPDFTSWFPDHYAGHPLNVFYHPMFTYLVAALGHFTSIEISHKIVVAFFVLATPVAAYCVGRRHLKTPVEQVLWLAWVWAIMRHTPITWGGNLASTLVLGAGANMAAMPFFFFYLAVIPDVLEGRRIALASVIAALAALAHVYSAITMAFCLIALLTFAGRSVRAFLSATIHFLLSTLLSAFWLVPFAVNLPYMRGSALTNEPAVAPFFAVFVIVSALFIQNARRPDFSQDNSMLYIVFGLTIAMHLRYVPDLPIQFHRFQIYVAYLAFFPIIRYMTSLRTFRPTPLDAGVVLAAVLIISTFSLSSRKGQTSVYPIKLLSIHGPPDVSLEMPSVEGRVLCVDSSYGNLGQQNRALPHLVSQSSENEVCLGLYMESAPNSPYLASLFRMFDQISSVWSPAPVNRLRPEHLERYLRLFHIRHVLSVRPLHNAFKDMLSLSSVEISQESIGPPEALKFQLYETANPSERIEPLTTPPKSVTNDWQQAVDNWWISDDIETILVDTDNSLPETVGDGTERIEDIEVSDSGDHWKFTVTAKKETPVLIKNSYFPNWRAYQDGQEISIYRASPCLSLIWAIGKVELKYERLDYEQIVRIISALTCLALATVVLIRAARTLLNRSTS